MSRIDCNEIVKRMEERLSADYQIELHEASTVQLHNALAEAVMAVTAKDCRESRRAHERVRRAYYFSAEYLMGRSVFSNLYNLGILDEMRTLLRERGADISAMEEIDDAALGNGGLGRLAACYLDSAATLGIPLEGYGLRYKFGLFKQTFVDGFQVEKADDWLKYGDPWSKRRDDKTVTVEFADQKVLAVPYDMPVFGYNTAHSGTLRLWQSEPIEEFDFNLFNEQEYALAVREKNMVEDITRVLYPNDSTYAGKRLRLKQQYFLSSASLQDIVRRYKRTRGTDMSMFASHCSIQLNDTHPVVSIPELIRLMMLEGMDFNAAFETARKTFNYTNHTVMSEALERWDEGLFSSVVPELTGIIYRINERLNDELRARGASDEMRSRMQIIDNGTIHMARLAVYVSSAVNGVAKIHTDILKNDLFRDWYALYPERFQNKTNGITPRRFLGLCNPEYAALIAEKTGSYDFIADLSQISKLKEHIDDDTIAHFNEIKAKNKRRLSSVISEKEGVLLPTDFVYDVQVKRLHEYKRQLLNGLHILSTYQWLRENPNADFTPKTYFFGAKAAPGYYFAKEIIRFIAELGEAINKDPAMKDKLKVIYLEDYRVTVSEILNPAAEISQQISLAGTEASGTSNMKLMINGAITLGTLDGANVEIHEAVGSENMFLFGMTTPEVNLLRQNGYNPYLCYNNNPALKKAIDEMSVSGFNGMKFEKITQNLLSTDRYMVLADYSDYAAVQEKASQVYKDQTAWNRMSLVNIAQAGRFAADRAIREYARDIWGASPVKGEITR